MSVGLRSTCDPPGRSKTRALPSATGDRIIKGTLNVSSFLPMSLKL